MSYKHSYKFVIQFHVWVAESIPLDVWPRSLVSCDNMASTKTVSILSLVCVGAAESFCAVNLIHCPVSFLCGIVIEWHDQVESLRKPEFATPAVQVLPVKAASVKHLSCAFQFYSRQDSHCQISQQFAWPAPVRTSTFQHHYEIWHENNRTKKTLWNAKRRWKKFISDKMVLKILTKSKSWKWSFR